MKVIAKINSHRFVCEVSKGEIAKCMENTYGPSNELNNHINVGEEIDIGKGYDFYSKIKQMLGDVGNLVNSNRTKLDVIFNAVQIFARKDDDHS